MLPYKKTSFLQGFSDDTNLAKSPEIRRFSTFIYLFLTANKPSQHEPSARTYRRTEPL